MFHIPFKIKPLVNDDSHQRRQMPKILDNANWQLNALCGCQVFKSKHSFHKINIDLVSSCSVRRACLMQIFSYCCWSLISSYWEAWSQTQKICWPLTPDCPFNSAHIRLQSIFNINIQCQYSINIFNIDIQCQYTINIFNITCNSNCPFNSVQIRLQSMFNMNIQCQ